MHIPDLSECRYHKGPFDSRNWSVPLLAVGWLESPVPFERGPTPPELVARLTTLVEQAHRISFFLGIMSCSLCRAEGLRSPGPVWSQENLFVPGSNVVYIAPGGIVHYVESHSYLPPREFVEAIGRCPDPETPEYWQALRKANADVQPPLRPH